MKLLLICALIGVAVASFNDVSYKGKKDPDQLKEEIGNKLSGVIEKLLGKLQALNDKGITKFDKILSKVKKLSDKLSDLQFKISDKIKELVEEFKEKNPELYEKIREALNLVDEETTEGEGAGDASTEAGVARADYSLKNVFKRLRKLITDIVDKEALKQEVEKLFGKGTELAERIINLIKEKGEEGKKKLLELVDRVLEDKEPQRSVSEMFEKLKDYFKTLNLELKEKYARFGQWVKDRLGKGLDRTKDRVQNLKKIAKEFLEHAKDVRKEVAEEALEFLRLYKDDLGSVWQEVRDKVKEILSRDN